VKPSRFCVRAYSFEPEVSDGHTMEGYAAVFNRHARVPAMGREPAFDEMIERSAFTKTLAERMPVLQFDHGNDPRTGTVPIGAFEDVHPDEHGLYVRARLFDNPVVEPIRQAIEGKALRGMSFKMRVNNDTWTRRGTEVDLRSVKEVELYELGPVVHPVYTATSVSVRSMMMGLDDDERRRLLYDLVDYLRNSSDGAAPAGTPSAGAVELDTSGLTRAARERALSVFP